jgi:hypothetical protein
VAFALFFTAFTLVIFFWYVHSLPPLFLIPPTACVGPRFIVWCVVVVCRADTLHAMRNTTEQREGAYDIGFFRSWKARAFVPPSKHQSPSSIPACPPIAALPSLAVAVVVRRVVSLAASCRAFIVVNGVIYLGQVAFIVVFIVVDDHKREGARAIHAPSSNRPPFLVVLMMRDPRVP